MHLNNGYAILRCEGVDALRFLQGQLSADIALIQGAQGGLACALNLKGRIIAAAYIYLHEGAYDVITPRDQMACLLADLQKYAVFSKVTLRDLSDQFHITPQLSAEPRTDVQRYAVLKEGEDLRFILTDRASLFVGAPLAAPVDSAPFSTYLIENHIPTIAAAQRELFLPHDIGLIPLGAVSFDKGCYRGQEIVARMHYRGKLKKQLAHCVLEGEHSLTPGTTIPQGEVVNTAIHEGKTFVLVIS